MSIHRSAGRSKYRSYLNMSAHWLEQDALKFHLFYTERFQSYHFDKHPDKHKHRRTGRHKDTHTQRDTTENTIDVAALVVYRNRNLTTRLKINFHRANCNPHVQQVYSKPSSKQPLNNFIGDTHLDIQIGDHSLSSKMSRHSVSSQWSCQWPRAVWEEQIRIAKQGL